MKNSSVSEKITSVAICLFPLFYLLSLEGAAARDLARSMDAKSWRTTQGVIEAQHIESSKGESRYYDTPFVTYLYAVEGQAYKGGSTYLHDDGWSGFATFRSRPMALEALKDYPVGKRVTVFFDPDNPNDAVLDRDTRKGVVLARLYLFVGFPLGAGLFIWLLTSAGLPRSGDVALVVAVTLGWWLLVPTYDGNAENISGGDQVVSAFETRLAVSRPGPGGR
jgi:hypothetical protein